MFAGEYRNKWIAPYTQGLSSAEGWNSKLAVCLKGKEATDVFIHSEEICKKES